MIKTHYHTFRRSGALARGQVIAGTALVALGLAIGFRHGIGPRQAVADAAVTQPAAKKPIDLNVLTANVRMAAFDDGVNNWRQRRDLVCQTILAAKPDVVGTQETTPTQAAYMAQHLGPLQIVTPEHYETGSTGFAGEALAALTDLFVRTDRWTVLASQSGLVRPDAIQNPLSENAMYALAVLQSKQQPGVQVIVIDTHLRHGLANAVAGVKRLRDLIGTHRKTYPNAAAIVMGDLNHDRPAMDPVFGAAPLGLKDSFDYTAMPPGALWGTYHAFTGVSHARLPSDLIFVGSVPGGVSASFEPAVIDKDHDANGHYPSDHFFVGTLVHLATP